MVVSDRQSVLVRGASLVVALALSVLATGLSGRDRGLLRRVLYHRQERQ
jgi:hypothetical protein